MAVDDREDSYDEGGEDFCPGISRPKLDVGLEGAEGDKE